MTDKLNNEEVEDFTGFGKDGNETRLEFVREMNELLCDFLAVCDDAEQKLAIAEFVSYEIALLLSSAEDNLSMEIRVMKSFDEVYDVFELMVSSEYEKLVENTEAELLEEIMEEAKEYLDEFDEDDGVNREFCILITAKDILDPCGCGCDCEDEHGGGIEIGESFSKE